jgi:hypothetical protein
MIKGSKMSEESKKKVSESLMGNQRALGHSYKHTEKSIQKIHERMMGNQYTLGYKHSEETVQKMRKIKMGNQYGLGNKSRTVENPIHGDAFHIRMVKKKEIKNCFICNITNEEHKKIYKRRLDLHCRDGNWANADSDNWVVVCTKDHVKLDRFDFRAGKGREGIRGHIGEKGE